MELVDAQRRALEEIRSLLRRFVRGEINTAEFIPRYRSLFAPFDPPDLTTGRLSAGERDQLDVFIQIMGGWFGEHDELIPKRSGWEYGKDVEPYSWIDGEAYRGWIRLMMNQAGLEV